MALGGETMGMCNLVRILRASSQAAKDINIDNFTDTNASIGI